MVEIDGWIEKKVKDENESKIKIEDTYLGRRSIKTVDNHVYLGDTISSDFSNRNNIMSNIAKGIAASRDILLILEVVFFEEYYFNALKLHRELMLISVLTNNLEVSFNLSVKDLNLLSDVDAKLLRAAMKTSAKSSSILLLLELGLCSIEYILKKKRLGYLHQHCGREPTCQTSLSTTGQNTNSW